MIRPKYFQIKDHEWFEPGRDEKNFGGAFRFVCCDCGLAHDVEFNSNVTDSGLPLEIRMVRNKRATARNRRGK